MGGPGAVQVGRPDTSSTTGSIVNLVPRSCQVLGFWANATTTIAVHDSAGTTANLVVNITACAVGWNPLPIDLVNGLAVNQAAQVWFSVL